MEIKLTSTDRTDYVVVEVCCCHGDEAVILNVVASVHISLSCVCLSSLCARLCISPPAAPSSMLAFCGWLGLRWRRTGAEGAL